MQNYKIREKIGSGGFSTVFKAFHLSHPKKTGNNENEYESQTVALKCIQVHSLDELNFALREAQCCIGLSHPNIVKCYEFFIDKKKVPDAHMISAADSENAASIYDFPSSERWSVCLAFEYCSQGTLKHLINRASSSKKPIALNKVLKWMFQILSALSHMHDRKMLHRDMKPENVFVLQGGDVRVGDMGLAKQLEATMNANSVLGTSYFMSPEIRTENPVYDSKIDVWGAGCILCELLTCKRVDYAYEMMVNPNAMYTLIDDRYHSHVSDNNDNGGNGDGEEKTDSQSLLSNLKDMMRSMLTHDSKLRPDCNTILAKYFMASIPIFREQSLVSQITTPMIDNRSYSRDSLSSSSLSSLSSSSSTMSKSSRGLFYDRLSIDCYVLLFSFMGTSDVVRCSMVCSQWHEIIHNSTVLYKILFQTTLQINTDASSFDTTHYLNAKTMRDAYMNRARLEHNWVMNKYKYTGFQMHEPQNLIATCSLYQSEKITNGYIKRIYEKQANRAYANSQVPKQGTHGNKVQNVKQVPEFVDFGQHALVITGCKSHVRLSDMYGFGVADHPLRSNSLQLLKGHTSSVVAIKFKPEVLPRLIFSGGVDRSICFYDILGTDTPLHVIPDVLVRQIWDMDLLSSDVLVVGGEDAVVKAYDITSRSAICSFGHDHKGPVYALKSDHSQIYTQCFATGSSDGTVSIFDLRDSAMSKRHTIQATKQSVYELYWDGYELFTGHSDGSVAVQDIRRLGGVDNDIPTLFSINGSFGAVRGLTVDSSKISCGFLGGALGVYSRTDGRFLNKLDHNEDKKLISTTMSCSCANDSILMGSDFNGVLSVYDFSCGMTPQGPAPPLSDQEDTPPVPEQARQNSKTACRTQ